VGPGAALQFVNGTNQALIGRMQAGLHLWSLSDGTLVQAFNAPFQGVSAALFTPDQKSVVAIGESEMQVALWGWPEGEPRGLVSEVSTVYPRYVALARDGKPRSWWNPETGEPLPEARPLPAGIQPQANYADNAVLSPDGRKLLTYGIVNGETQWLHLWDIETGRLLWHHPGRDLPMIYRFRPGATCAAIAFSPDGSKLAIGGRGERVEVRGIDGERPKQELSTPAGSSDWVAFLPNGKQLLTWGGKTMRIWDLGSGQLVRAFQVPVVNCLTVTPNGQFLLVGGDGEFRGL
jgi:WD40 repeat protein